MTYVRSLSRFVVTTLTSMFFSDLAFFPLPRAGAQPADAVSTYTSSADKSCRKVSSVKVGDTDYGSERICPGVAGLVVLKIEQDLREIVSAGRDRKQAGAEPAASQSFGPFNSTTDTIEWRTGSGGKPYAMIQRWHIADNSDMDKDGRPNTKQMLVVTRLPPGAVCHVAYVDVKANPDANTVARQAADDLARGFDCAKDKVTAAGEKGRTTSLTLPRR